MLSSSELEPIPEPPLASSISNPYRVRGLPQEVDVRVHGCDLPGRVAGGGEVAAQGGRGHGQDGAVGVGQGVLNAKKKGLENCLFKSFLIQKQKDNKRNY